MKDKEKILKILYTVIDEVNATLSEEQRVSKSQDAVLIGKSSTIDSLTLVTLIITAEQQIEAEYRIIISLADDRAMSLKKSPFKTVGTLTDYIMLLLKENESERY